MPAPPAATGALSRLKASGAHQKILAFASLIVLLVFFSLASPNFLQTSNILAILQATSVNGVLAIAATLVIITGGIDLSVGTLMTFCAVIAGVVLTFWGMALPFGIIAAIAAGTFCGFISGSLIARMKIPPFIATLGMMLILKGLSLVISGTKLSADLDRFADWQLHPGAAGTERGADPVRAGTGDFLGSVAHNAGPLLLCAWIKRRGSAAVRCQRRRLEGGDLRLGRGDLRDRGPSDRLATELGPTRAWPWLRA